MSRDDNEFAAFLAARWPLLVRTLVLLGVPERVAHGVAEDALSRVYPDFSRLSREEDLDVAVYRELFDARDRHARHQETSEDAGGADQPEAAPPSDVPEWMGDPQERLEQLRAALDTMTPQEREVVVLQHVAELSDDQVADVLERPMGAPPRLAAPDVRLALEAIPVDPLHAGDVADAARVRRRRLWTRTGGVLLGLVLVALAATWVADRLDTVGDVQAADNPLPVAWYAEGTLHLSEVTVGVRPVLELVGVPDGVVLTNDRAQVLFIEHDGDQQQIGDTVTGTSLVVEPDNGWVAWADPGDGDPELVVYDTRVGDEVGRRSLADPASGGGQPVGDSHAVAIDGERVYFRTRDTDFAWAPLTGEAFALSGELVDIAAGARISRAPDPAALIVQAQPFDTGRLIVGTDARLTPDGRYVMADVDEDLAVFDVATGEEVPRMHSPSDEGRSWTYVGDDTFLVTVLHKLQDKRYQDTLQMPDQGDYRVYECVPGRDDVCVEVHRVPRESPDAPVLAR
ncbi:RNA polymerase sigma factor [Nocardioides sp.]|uniref:RNA polymerase sigma factor n=1 Tax=Nocardioides sp. TaxID=35761 RepID=UPI002ED16109